MENLVKHIKKLYRHIYWSERDDESRKINAFSTIRRMVTPAIPHCTPAVCPVCEAKAMSATHAAPPDLRPPPGLPQPPAAAAKAEPLRKQYEAEGQRWGDNPAWVDAERTQPAQYPIDGNRPGLYHAMTDGTRMSSQLKAGSVRRMHLAIVDLLCLRVDASTEWPRAKQQSITYYSAGRGHGR